MKKLYYSLSCLVILSGLFNCVNTKNESLHLNETIAFKEQVDAQAQFERGLMYYWGKGTPQNYKEALKWFSKSAKQGNADAQYVLGGMYYLGDGVQQDYVLAYMWFDLAAAQGNVKALEIMGVTAKKMSPAQIEKAQNLAREQKADPDIVK
jgi:TPR repeat protein